MAGTCVCAQSYPTLWNPEAVACQAPLSMEFSRQLYWSRWAFSTPGDLPNPGIEPMSLVPPLSAGGFFTTSTTGEVLLLHEDITTACLVFSSMLQENYEILWLRCEIL